MFLMPRHLLSMEAERRLEIERIAQLATYRTCVHARSMTLTGIALRAESSCALWRSSSRVRRRVLARLEDEMPVSSPRGTRTRLRLSGGSRPQPHVPQADLAGIAPLADHADELDEMLLEIALLSCDAIGSPVLAMYTRLYGACGLRVRDRTGDRRAARLRAIRSSSATAQVPASLVRPPTTFRR